MTSNSRKFVTGFSVAAVVAVLLNFLPYVATRGAYHGDGFEVIGFPFVFRRYGGFEGIYEFNIPPLLADIAFGAVAAVFVGYAYANLGRRAGATTTPDLKSGGTRGEHSSKKVEPHNWKKQHTRLWNTLVPGSGQADTLQGELIRIAGKLTDQAYRNGNLNWDAEHERMWRFVGQHLDDAKTFSDDECALIRDKIAEIIRDHDKPDLSEDGSCYYFISEKVVDWCMAHPVPIPHQKDPRLQR